MKTNFLKKYKIKVKNPHDKMEFSTGYTQIVNNIMLIEKISLRENVHTN